MVLQFIKFLEFFYLGFVVEECYHPSILAAVLLADEKEFVLKMMSQQSLETLDLLLVAEFGMMV